MTGFVKGDLVIAYTYPSLKIGASRKDPGRKVLRQHDFREARSRFARTPKLGYPPLLEVLDMQLFLRGVDSLDVRFL